MSSVPVPQAASGISRVRRRGRSMAEGKQIGEAGESL
jgi:hypothetical protein